MIENLHSMRIDYSGKDLIKKKFKKNPIKQFNLWFQEAIHKIKDIWNKLYKLKFI